MTFQVQTVDEDGAHTTGDVFELFDHRRGFVCRGKDQPNGKCQDYRIRYFCRQNTIPKDIFELENNIWSEFINIDHYQLLGDYESPSRLKTKLPCLSPSRFEAREVKSKMDARKTGQVFQRYDAENGIICNNHDQVLQ